MGISEEALLEIFLDDARRHAFTSNDSDFGDRMFDLLQEVATPESFRLLVVQRAVGPPGLEPGTLQL